MAWIAGVDGCKGGWIAVYEETASRTLTCRIVKEFEDVFGMHHPPLAVVAVDMPIGLWDTGGRDCDTCARDVLRPLRNSSIFSAPAAGVIDRYCEIREQLTYDCAKKLNEELTGTEEAKGKGLSRQSYALVPKIAEVRGYLLGRPSDERDCVHEVHPEVSFAAMNAQRGSPSRPICLSKGHEMRHPKKTLAGLVERREILKEFFGTRFEELEAKAAEFDPDGRAALDDFYDALACLWTARRIQKGPDGPARALCGIQDIHPLSDGAPSGANDLPMRIVY